MKTKKQRFVSSFLAVILILNLIDGRVLSYCWQQLKAFAAAQDYTGYFQWDISELTTPPENGSASGENPVIITDKNGKQMREITLTNNTDLFLKESADDNPVLKTTFYFNLKRGVDAGLLEFTITGMDELIRNGTLKLNDQDPNLVKTWEITQDEKTGNYTFKNKVRVTSNNETTFTWQFNSREAVTDTNITLNTECKITEIEYDPDTGLEVKREQITLDTNDLIFSYESEPDKSQVKIVCEDLEELDVNNLNVDYDWRSYRSTLGLEGITEYTKTNGGQPFRKTRADFETDNEYNTYIKNIAEYMGYLDDATGTASEKFLNAYADGEGNINWDALTLYNAHAIKQSREEQVKSQMARGIKRADYFIEVKKPDDVDWKDILVVNSNGDRVPVVETQINGNTVWGFYDFQGAGDRKPGEAYSCVYRVGVLNDTIKNATEELNIELKGHYLVTYQDTTAPVDYTDSAAHKLSIIDEQPIGDGDYLHKFNNYEINNGTTYNGVEYQSHAKHYSPVNQLLYDSVFNGRTVTYSLSASTKQATYADGKTEDTNGKARKYDLIYEDYAPAIKNLSGADDRTLTYKEYDFTRVSISKLVDGNTVGVIDPTVTNDIAYKDEKGFPFVIYGKSNDSENVEYYNTWKEVGSGTTLSESEVLLPAGIDEIQIVVKDLTIRAYLRAFVDIQYNLDSDLRNHIYIDTAHDYETVEVTDGDGNLLYDDDGNVRTKIVRKEDTNKGTHLVNTFTRKQYLDTNYSPDSFNATNFQNERDDHSNTWLRESTTTIDSHTSIEDFKFHTLTEEELKEHGGIPSDYYTTIISSGGTIQSDTESSLNHFAIYSKLPNGVTPSEGWLEQFKESLIFDGVLQGTNKRVDAQFMMDNNAVTVYYDAGTKCIVAEFECNGFSFRADQLVSVDFSYPAEISLAKVKSSGLAQTPFVTETYLTVLDDNVKLSPAKDKTLTEVNETPYQKAKSAKSSANTKVSALGSQKNNYSTKSVRSFYNDWVYDNDTEVDGSNTHHLEENRMTSEYDYALAFHRITTENEVVENPMILDIVEGLRGSAWHGRVNKIYFDSKSYPADSDYHPVVYYILSKEDGVDNINVTVAEGGDYSKKNNTIMEAISHFQQYGNQTDVSSMSGQYESDLGYYRNLKSTITGGQQGWTRARENSDGSWSIEQNDVYAVAIIFEGTYNVTNGYLELGAYMSMTAPALENNSDAEKIINNRATYNEAHVFAQGTDANGTNFPMYSVSNRTLVVLRHSVELEKVDSKNNRRLSGAKFTIFSKDLGETGFANNKENSNIVSYYTFDKRRNKNDINQFMM